MLHSRCTVRTEVFNTSAVSSSLKPPKKRSSTSRLLRSSNLATSLRRASSLRQASCKYAAEPLQGGKPGRDCRSFDLPPALEAPSVRTDVTLSSRASHLSLFGWFGKILALLFRRTLYRQRKEYLMLKTIITLAVSAVILSAAEPYLGTWKANVAKSKYSPGPAPKSHVATYTKDGEWVVLKTDTVAADGQTVSASNRYKRDGKEYPFDGPTVGKGTIAVKAIGDHITDATLKSDGGRHGDGPHGRLEGWQDSYADKHGHQRRR